MAASYKCAWCGSTTVRPSRLKGLAEILMSFIGAFYRCVECGQRSYKQTLPHRPPGKL